MANVMFRYYAILFLKWATRKISPHEQKIWLSCETRCNRLEKNIKPKFGWLKEVSPVRRTQIRGKINGVIRLLPPNSPNSILIHKLSTGQVLNDRGARRSNSLKLRVQTPMISPVISWIARGRRTSVLTSCILA